MIPRTTAAQEAQNSIFHSSKPHAAKCCEFLPRWPAAPFWRTSFPGRCSVAYAQRAPSAADLVPSMRAKFNAAPIETQKLADNVTMLSGPGGRVAVLTAPAVSFVLE